MNRAALSGNPVSGVQIEGGPIWAKRGLVSGANSERASDFWGQEPASQIYQALPPAPKSSQRFLTLGFESGGCLGESGLRGGEFGGGGAIWAPQGLVSGATSGRASDFWGQEPASKIP